LLRFPLGGAHRKSEYPRVILQHRGGTLMGLQKKLKITARETDGKNFFTSILIVGIFGSCAAAFETYDFPRTAECK
jgi:hypothetical protein